MVNVLQRIKVISDWENGLETVPAELADELERRAERIQG